jgi:hypothetical protein
VSTGTEAFNYAKSVERIQNAIITVIALTTVLVIILTCISGRIEIILGWIAIILVLFMPTDMQSYGNR